MRTNEMFIFIIKLNKNQTNSFLCVHELLMSEI